MGVAHKLIADERPLVEGDRGRVERVLGDGHENAVVRAADERVQARADADRRAVCGRRKTQTNSAQGESLGSRAHDQELRKMRVEWGVWAGRGRGRGRAARQ